LPGLFLAKIVILESKTNQRAVVIRKIRTKDIYFYFVIFIFNKIIGSFCGKNWEKIIHAIFGKNFTLAFPGRTRLSPIKLNI